MDGVRGMAWLLLEYGQERKRHPANESPRRATMNTLLSQATLERENRRFRGTGGRSEENREQGFRPAFLDADTQTIYASRFSDGRPAPFHLLEGLPDEIVLTRHPSGRVATIKASVTSGFVRQGRFYTREEAAQCVAFAEA